MDTICDKDAHEWSLVVVLSIPPAQIERFKIVGSLEIRGMGDKVEQVTGPICKKCNILIYSVFPEPKFLNDEDAEDYLHEN